MTANEATGLIRIIKTPSGGAPEEIRRAWVGITLPCAPILGYSGGVEFQIPSLKKVRNRYCFHVPQRQAIEALEQVVPEAAKWWRDHGYPEPDTSFSFTFNEDEAEIIYGVIRQRLIEISDLDPGVNDRFLA